MGERSRRAPYVVRRGRFVWTRAGAPVRARRSEAVPRGGGERLGSTSRRRIGGLFVVSEMALALMLLIGSALLVRSFIALRTVDRDSTDGTS